MTPSPPGASFNGGTINWPAGGFFVSLFVHFFFFPPPAGFCANDVQLDKNKLDYVEKEV